MSRKSEHEKLAELEATAAKIKERIKDQKAKLRNKQRKDDARRKIIVGATMLAHAEEHPEFADQLWQILNAHVMRDSDRITLRLKPRQAPANQSEKMG